jgi:hypothetical protein
MGLRKDDLISKLKANKLCVGTSERRLCRKKNKPQNSDKSKFVFFKMQHFIRLQF